MMEKDHVHITFIKSGELSQYQKFWPNHVFFVLPTEFDNGSDSSIKNIIKVIKWFCANCQPDRFQPR